MNINHQQIAILDFGSQYTHLIARRFRQLKVLAKIYPADYDVSQISDLIGVVLSGGPSSVNDSNNKYELKAEIFNLNIPVLGLCFGHQLLAKVLGGKVASQGGREYGQAGLLVKAGELFKNLSGEEVVWMSHGDCVIELPPGFVCIGTTNDKSIAAMADERKRIYGLQFHPEVTHTKNGLQILRNFAFAICQARGDWDVSNLREEILRAIKAVVGNKNVFLLVSGGIDSTICFALLEKALGKDRVYGLYVDTGMMRQGESEQIKSFLAAAGFANLHIEYAAPTFLKNLSGVKDPEDKRQIIGRTFLQVKDKVTRQMNLSPQVWMLGQGTIYPDTIETGGSQLADVIKTHHNRVAAIQNLITAGQVVEPIKDLYKDEVRGLGRSLGLPKEIVDRHPFPGPGLAIRLLCSDGQAVFKKAEQEEINQTLCKFIEGKSLAIDNVFILPLKSVGVQGDNRTYAYPAVLQTKDFDYQILGNLSSAITNQLNKINRVLLELSDFASSKNSSSKLLIKAAITKERLDLLRQIDYLVMAVIKKHNLYDQIWQFPVVLLPYGFDNKESVVLRPVLSQEAMTAKFYPLPKPVRQDIILALGKLGKISCLFLDITNKPPGTIEWE